MNNETVDLPRIASCISSLEQKYHILGQQDMVAVAFSGGKDSLILALALKQLGRTPVLLSVDMGYDQDWSRRIKEIAETHSLAAHVISVRDPAVKALVLDHQRPTLEANLHALDAIGTFTTPLITPCTYCYNAKIFGLRLLLDQIGQNSVAFGHHGTDAVASLLKAAFMHLDRWRDGNERFHRANFERITADFAREQQEEQKPCWVKSEYRDALNRLVAQGLAGTDEPPLERLAQFGLGITITRPMFYVLEADLIALKMSMSLKTEGSGCGHSATLESQTPREIVQLRALRPLESTPGGRDSVRRLITLIERTLDDQGNLQAHSRAERGRLLGANYKPMITGLDKIR